MKHLVVLFLFLLLSVFASAQKITGNKVPPQVGKAFRDRFPAAQQDSWSMEGPNTFEVEFFNGKKRQSATFDKDGKWLGTESEIGFQLLPRPVAQAFNKDFQGFQVQDIQETDTPDKGIIYEMSVFKGQENYELIYSPKGELISKESGADRD